MQAERLHDTRSMSREEWLLSRRSGIGGSEAAAILGYNRYRSAYAVWADKLGLLEEQADNERMRQGRDFEQYVADRFCEANRKRVHRVNAVLRHSEYPWMLANIDRKVVGENAGLECKTSRDIYLRQYRNGAYPAEYYLQCMHYMAVTGYPYWYLCVLVYGDEPRTFRIERDEADIAELIKAEQYFWTEHVVKGIQPPPDGSDSTAEALKSVYAESISEPVLECSQPDIVRRYIEVGQELNELKGEQQALKNALKGELGAHERMSTSEYLISWKANPHPSLDTQSLQSDHPEIDLSEYTRCNMVRRFSVRKAKEA